MIGINQDGAVIAVFEGGDIITTWGYDTKEKEAMFGIREATKTYPIGTIKEALEKEDKDNEPVIMFYFKKSASVDVVINCLLKIREKLIEFEEV